MSKSMETREPDNCVTLGTVGVPSPKKRTIDPNKVNVSPLNLRFVTGEIGGVKVNSTYDIQGIKEWLLSEGDLKRTLTMYHGANDELYWLQGNRTGTAIRSIVADNLLPESVKEPFKKLEVLDYGPLTDAQVVLLINDQNDKRFSKSELVRQMVRMYEKGYSYPDMLNRMLYQLEAFSTKAAETIALAEKESDKGKRTQILNKVFDGPVRKKIWNQICAGPAAQEQLILHYLYREGKIDGKPYDSADPLGPCKFIPSQTRGDALLRAYKADVNGGAEGGVYPSVLKKMDEFHVEDITPATPTTGYVFKPTDKDSVKAIVSSIKSKALRQLLSKVSGCVLNGETIPTVDLNDVTKMDQLTQDVLGVLPVVTISDSETKE